MKVVLNKCFGGFSLSMDACVALNLSSPYATISRIDEMLITLIEEMGSEWASGSCAKLRIVEVPDDVTDWEINDYDGIETITYVLNGKLGHC